MEQLANVFNLLLILYLGIGWPVYLWRTIKQYYRMKGSPDENLDLLWLSTVTEMRIIGLMIAPLGAAMGWNHLYLVFVAKERSF